MTLWRLLLFLLSGRSTEEANTEHRTVVVVPNAIGGKIWSFEESTSLDKTSKKSKQVSTSEK
jgi:hypothetical protein